jgi:hypothetical protein
MRISQSSNLTSVHLVEYVFAPWELSSHAAGTGSNLVCGNRARICSGDPENFELAWAGASKETAAPGDRR